MPFVRRYLPLLTVALAIASFYLYDLNGVGVLGPDEPRYAAIGRAMAQTGDLITPKLWGCAWFEKPPLLYWLTAAGAWAGLSPDVAGRLPVVLLSLLFLVAAFELLRREFGFDAAAVCVTLLATSAGWITFSSLCLTDLPLAVFFSLAVLLALPLAARSDKHETLRFLAIGASIGFAMLAKGLVPIVLAAPFLWFLRTRWRKWWIAILACIVVAGPWYSAVYAVNGYAFIQDFVLKQHFERLYSAALQHVQPWYYYFPVFLAGLFPWTPLLGLLAVRDQKWDERRHFLMAMVLWGFIFFSISVNKLPGYLLPLMPSVFVLIGACFEGKFCAALSRWWLLPCAVLIGTLPVVAGILPQALAAGRISAVVMNGFSATTFFYVALPVVTVLLARRTWIEWLLVLCVVAGGIYVKTVAYPVLDRRVSAREFWKGLRGKDAGVCDNWIPRDWAYGLAFYRGAPYPNCDSGHYTRELHAAVHGPPVLQARR